MSAFQEFAEEGEDAGDGLFVGNGDAELRLSGNGVGLDQGLGQIPDTFLRAQGLSQTGKERDTLADKDFGRCRTDFPNPLSLFRRLVFSRSAPCSCFLSIPDSIHDDSLFLFRDDFGTNARLHIGILNRIH